MENTNHTTFNPLSSPSHSATPEFQRKTTFTTNPMAIVVYDYTLMRYECIQSEQSLCHPCWHGANKKRKNPCWHGGKGLGWPRMNDDSALDGKSREPLAESKASKDGLLGIKLAIRFPLPSLQLEENIPIVGSLPADSGTPKNRNSFHKLPFCTRLTIPLLNLNKQGPRQHVSQVTECLSGDELSKVNKVATCNFLPIVTPTLPTKVSKSKHEKRSPQWGRLSAKPPSFNQASPKATEKTLRVKDLNNGIRYGRIDRAKVAGGGLCGKELNLTPAMREFNGK